MKHTYILVTLLGLTAGCGAASTSQELKSARNAYDDAQRGSAAQVAPKELHLAQAALQQAEKAQADDANSNKARHLAYVAERKAEFAIAFADAKTAEQEEERATTAYQEALEKRAATATEQRESATADLQVAQRDLKAEQQAREKAEQQAADARKRLEEMAQVKGDQENFVITLSGSVLFPSGSSELLPVAADRLTTVVDALEGYGAKPIVIEGYTDSRGTEEFNQELSTKRAQAVQAFLVQHGMDASKVSVVGRGEAKPVASNDTPEGRANNRRVEIIVGDAQKAQSQPQQTQNSPKLPETTTQQSSLKPSAADGR